MIALTILTTVAELVGRGGVKGVVAENLILKQQLIVLNRTRRRAPNLRPIDRVLLGVWSLFLKASRISKVAVVVRPSTLLTFHQALVRRKYRLLFSSRTRRKPGPKGPSEKLTDAIVEMKQRNTRYGCPRIAQQLAKAFGIEIDKDVVRRVLAKYYRPILGGGGDGPSWLTVLGHMKDSLWVRPGKVGLEE